MKIATQLKNFIVLVLLVITLSSFITPTELTSCAASGNLIIMLDPGHGGKDGGAENTVNGVYYNENILMLKVANYAKEELLQYPGVTVLMTRESTETYLTLSERVSKATRNGAHAIISIHANSYSQSSVNGAEALVACGNYRPSVAAETQSLGTKILSQLQAIGLKNRGNKINFDNQGEHIAYYPDGSLQDYYGIVQRALRAGIPGIIIETAFISNKSDVTNHFSSNEKLEKLGKAIATGIAQHYGLSKDKKVSATIRPHLDARALTFSGNPDTSFLYGQNGTNITQSDGYATLTQSSKKIQVYIDYRGMSFSADTYKYAVVRIRSSSENIPAIINTGASEISYDDPVFTYTATLNSDFQNILLDMSEKEKWTLGVNFMKIQLSGASSADIEYIKFYESKPAVENGIVAIQPSFVPTQTPAVNHTTKPTATGAVIATTTPTQKPETTSVVPTAQTGTPTQTQIPLTGTTPSIEYSEIPTQTAATQTKKETPMLSQTPIDDIPSDKAEESSGKSNIFKISLIIILLATLTVVIILIINRLKNDKIRPS